MTNPPHSSHAATLMASIPLANQANVAWTLAMAIRHYPDRAIALDRKRVLIANYRRASHPLIRRIATDVIGRVPDNGRVA